MKARARERAWSTQEYSAPRAVLEAGDPEMRRVVAARGGGVRELHVARDDARARPQPRDRRVHHLQVAPLVEVGAAAEVRALLRRRDLDERKHVDAVAADRVDVRVLDVLDDERKRARSAGQEEGDRRRVASPGEREAGESARDRAHAAPRSIRIEQVSSETARAEVRRSRRRSPSPPTSRRSSTCTCAGENGAPVAISLVGHHAAITQWSLHTKAVQTPVPHHDAAAAAAPPPCARRRQLGVDKKSTSVPRRAERAA